MTFCKAATTDQLWSGEMLPLVIGSEKIVLVRVDDSIYAYKDCCVHKGVELSRGHLINSTLTCSAHQWQFNVCSGRGVNPASACLTAFPVFVDNKEIWVDPDSPTRPWDVLESYAQPEADNCTAAAAEAAAPQQLRAEAACKVCTPANVNDPQPADRSAAKLPDAASKSNQTDKDIQSHSLSQSASNIQPEFELDLVGPILIASVTSDAVALAIKRLNRGAVIIDRGAYVRALVPKRCQLTRVAVEEELGHSFELPGKLEKIMPSFCGRLMVNENEAVWTI